MKRSIAGWSAPSAALLAVVFVILWPVFGVASLAAQNNATGVVRAEEVVSVRSGLAGIVGHIDVTEGQAVQQGDLLVRLRSDRQEIGVRLAEAQVSRAQAALKVSAVTLEIARNALARAELAGGALPRREREELADEVLRLQALSEVQQSEREQAEAELKLRQWELQETRLSAPFDGTVTNIWIARGDTLAPLDPPVLDLVNLDDLYVELVLSVEQISRVTEGRQLQVQVESTALGRSGMVSGVVSYINPTIDPSSRTFAVKITISDPAGRVRPGMRAEVVLR